MFICTSFYAMYKTMPHLSKNSYLLLFQLNKTNMFTKENGKHFLVTFVAVLGALAVHQMWIAKHIAPAAKKA